MIPDGYGNVRTLKLRITAMKEWLVSPVLIEAVYVVIVNDVKFAWLRGLLHDRRRHGFDAVFAANHITASVREKSQTQPLWLAGLIGNRTSKVT